MTILVLILNIFIFHWCKTVFSYLHSHFYICKGYRGRAFNIYKGEVSECHFYIWGMTLGILSPRPFIIPCSHSQFLLCFFSGTLAWLFWFLLMDKITFYINQNIIIIRFSKFCFRVIKSSKRKRHSAAGDSKHLNTWERKR